jgi:hypothetical protein
MPCRTPADPLLYKITLPAPELVAGGRPGERGNLPSAILMFVNAGAGDRGTFWDVGLDRHVQVGIYHEDRCCTGSLY